MRAFRESSHDPPIYPSPARSGPSHQVPTAPGALPPRPNPPGPSRQGPTAPGALPPRPNPPGLHPLGLRMTLTPYAADPIRRAAESIVIIHSDDIRTQQSVNNPMTEEWQLEHTFGYALYFLRHARPLVDAYHFRGLLDSVNNFARRGSGAQLVRRELSILFQEANQYALYEEFLDRFMPHWQRAMRRRQMEEEQGMGRGHHAPAGRR